MNHMKPKSAKTDTDRNKKLEYNSEEDRTLNNYEYIYKNEELQL